MQVSGKPLEAVKRIPKCTCYPECPRLGARSHTSPSSQGRISECNAEDCISHWSFGHLCALTFPFHKLVSKAPPSWQGYLLQISSPKLPTYFSADSLLLFPVPISDFLCCPHTTTPQGPAPLQVPLTSLMTHFPASRLISGYNVPFHGARAWRGQSPLSPAMVTDNLNLLHATYLGHVHSHVLSVCPA